MRKEKIEKLAKKNDEDCVRRPLRNLTEMAREAGKL